MQGTDEFAALQDYLLLHYITLEAIIMLTETLLKGHRHELFFLYIIVIVNL